MIIVKYRMKIKHAPVNKIIIGKIFNINNRKQLYIYDNYSLIEWIVPQFLNLRPKMAKSIVYVITLITNRNHAFHCLN